MPRSLRWFLFLLAVAASAQPHYNLDFETATRGRPRSWGIGSAGYEYVLDNKEFHSGSQSLRIRSLNPQQGSLGVASQTFPIELVKGKRVRVSGWLKTESVAGYAAMWWRVDGASGSLSLDNMSATGPRGTTAWTRYQFERDVSPNGVTIVFGVFLSGTGTAWFDSLNIEIDGVPFVDGPAPLIEPKPEHIDWVRKTAIPIAGADPNLSSDDLRPLKQLIGDARIVGLGEATHGTSEFFRMKHRIIKYLAEEMGFTIFAIEANMPEAYRVNDYVLNGRGDPRELLRGMYFWTWNTQEVLDMIEWMRQFNASGKGRIQFTGFDMQVGTVAADHVRLCVGIAEPEYLPLVDSLYRAAQQAASLIPAGAPQYQRQYIEAASGTTAIREYLESRRAAYIKQYAPADVDWMIQNARVAEQATWMLIGGTRLRDEQMANNIGWIADHNPGAKIVLWAHNGHVYRSQYAMGSYLADRYRKDYMPLGFAFHEGRYTANGPQGIVAYDAVPSYPGTVEYIFHQTGVPQSILDVRKASRDNPASSWLLGDMEYRMIGAVPIDGFGLTRNLAQEYDGLIYFDRSTASTLLR